MRIMVEHHLFVHFIGSKPGGPTTRFGWSLLIRASRGFSIDTLPHSVRIDMRRRSNAFDGFVEQRVLSS